MAAASTADLARFHDVHRGLTVLGYVRQTNSNFLKKAVAIDRDCFQGSPCEQCGSEQTEYHPYFKGHQIYVGIKACGLCGHCEEV